MLEYQMLTDRIRTLCEERNISYYSLAYKSRVPITTIMNIIHGTTKNPGIFTIIRICNGLDITIQELLEEMKMEESENQ